MADESVATLRVRDSFRHVCVGVAAAGDAVFVIALIYSIARGFVGVAIFAAVLIAGFSALMWKCYRSRIVVTPTELFQYFAIFPRTRISRSEIVGVQAKMSSTTVQSSGKPAHYLPFVQLANGQERPLMTMSRFSLGAAEREARAVRELLGLPVE